MISLLNRREVTVTHDMNRLNQLREKLDGAGIEHIVRNKRNRTFTAGRSHGVPNVDADYAYEYGIYVHRDDYQKARDLLFTRQCPWSLTGAFLYAFTSRVPLLRGGCSPSKWRGSWGRSRRGRG